MEITFDPAKLKFTGGTSNYVMFRVAPKAMPPEPKGMLDSGN